MSEAIMVFDVESNGLHGPGFAVGWVVFQAGVLVSEGFLYAKCESPTEWVSEHVIPKLGAPNENSISSVRSKFWDEWQKVKRLGGTLWADCPWPVEANFLSACVADKYETSPTC